MKMKGVILLNGEPYKGDIDDTNALVFCADGAYNWAKGRVRIDENLGDFDSAAEIPFPRPAEIFPSEKNETDGEIALEKMLALAEEKGITRIELYGGGIVGLCTMPKSLLTELQISEDDVDSISGFARSIEGVEIGIMIREVEDGGKISLRTSENYNASDLCRALGGGGHAAAAGATVPGGIPGARHAILSLLSQRGIIRER